MDIAPTNINALPRSTALTAEAAGDVIIGFTSYLVLHTATSVAGLRGRDLAGAV